MQERVRQVERERDEDQDVIRALRLEIRELKRELNIAKIQALSSMQVICLVSNNFF